VTGTESLMAACSGVGATAIPLMQRQKHAESRGPSLTRPLRVMSASLDLQSLEFIRPNASKYPCPTPLLLCPRPC
jgi:hypothetical protein